MIKELFNFEEGLTNPLDIIEAAKTLVNVLDDFGIAVSTEVRESIDTRSKFRTLIKSQDSVDLIEFLKEERWNFEYIMDFNALLAVILPERSTKLNYFSTSDLDLNEVCELMQSLARITQGEWVMSELDVTFGKTKKIQFNSNGKCFYWEFDELSIDFFQRLKSFSSENFKRGGFFIDLEGTCSNITYIDNALLKILDEEFAES